MLSELQDRGRGRVGVLAGGKIAKDRGIAAPVPARRAVDDHPTRDRGGW